MELPFLSAVGPCMLVVPEAYAGLVRYLHDLSIANDGGSGGGGVCGPWPPHGLGHPGRGAGGPGGGYPPTHPPPPPPRPDPTRPKGHHPGFVSEAAYRLADGGGSFSFPPSPPPTPPAPSVPQGQGAPEPGSDGAGSLRSDSGRSRASSTVVNTPFPVLPTPPRPGGRAPTVAAAAHDDDDDMCPSCRRKGGRVDAPANEDARRRREPGLRRSSRRNRPRDVRAEYEAGETPGEAVKRGTT